MKQSNNRNKTIVSLTVYEEDALLYQDALLLYLVQKFCGERTCSGIYHLLKGKKSSQSVQDSYLFHVAPFFHSCSELSRSCFDARIEHLQRAQLIKPIDAECTRFVLTEDGVKLLDVFPENRLIPDGLKIIDQINEEGRFWLKLQLLVQTVSALCQGQSAFLPVVRQPEISEHVRRLILSGPPTRDQLGRIVFNELYQLFLTMPDDEANSLSALLSGWKASGLTLDQMAEASRRDALECSILFKSALRRMMNLFVGSPDQFPFLSRLLIGRQSSLSKTAETTRKLLQTGLTLHDIASKRHLAVSTIEDHLVELTLKKVNHWLSDYLSTACEQQIMNVADHLKTRQLKPIKNHLGERVSYFQIRLALAKNAVSGRKVVRINEQ